MSDHPQSSPAPHAVPPVEQAGEDGSPVRPDRTPPDEKPLPDRTDDEAAALGDFARPKLSGAHALCFTIGSPKHG